MLLYIVPVLPVEEVLYNCKVFVGFCLTHFYCCCCWCFIFICFVLFCFFPCWPTFCLEIFFHNTPFCFHQTVWAEGREWIYLGNILDMLLFSSNLFHFHGNGRASDSPGGYHLGDAYESNGRAWKHMRFVEAERGREWKKSKNIWMRLTLPLYWKHEHNVVIVFMLACCLTFRRYTFTKVYQLINIWYVTRGLNYKLLNKEING